MKRADLGWVLLWGIVATGCNAAPASSTEPVSKGTAALYSINTPTTVTAGTPSTLTASCPGHQLPDQCGSWAGVELSATSSIFNHGPGSQSEDDRCVCKPIAFQVPASLPVTAGSSGIGEAELEYRPANGHDVTCLYVGNERLLPFGRVTGGDAYNLVACSDLRKAGASTTADWFSLRVNSGNPRKGPTRVQLRLGAPDVVNGVVQEEIVYAHDARIPGAALHVPRGSAPADQTFSISVLAQPAVGATIDNAGDSLTTAGYAVDVHATGIDNFQFTPVPGATCPRIDLPYSPAQLAKLLAAGDEGRLRVRQITNLAGISGTGSVLAQTADVTVDTVNHIASFCVSHLSYYVTGANGNDDRFTQADIAMLPLRACTGGGDCRSSEECLDSVCYTNATSAKPTLVPGAKYQLRLQFLNPTSTMWMAGSLKLASMQPRNSMPPYVPTPLTSSPWFPGSSAQYIQSYGGAPVGLGGTVTFTVPVTAPVQEQPSPPQYPFGSALDLCLQRGAAYMSECFSWDPNDHNTAYTGSAEASLTEICDGIDNDGNGEIDDLNGDVSREPGKACDNGLAGTCARSGAYKCADSSTIVCDTEAVTVNSCGGCTALPQEQGATCDNGEPGACARTGTVRCSGADAITCDAPHIEPSSLPCGCSQPADYGQACGCSGTVQCDGTCSNPPPFDNDGHACGGPFYNTACLNADRLGQGLDGLPFPPLYPSCVSSCEQCDAAGFVFFEPNSFDYSGGLFGGDVGDRIVGGDCEPGYGPAGCFITKVDGDGGCEVTDQAPDYTSQSGPNGMNPASCRCKIHYAVNRNQSGTCHYQIDEFPLLDGPP